MRHVDLVSVLIKTTQKELDDIEWEDARDPRIEGLIEQLNYYKNQAAKGVIYEPRF